MVQEFHVVRCFCCQSFQVQQVKKANRWSCKLCGEKQSLLKEFGRGSGADCRRHVQKLNAMRGAVMEEQEHNTWSLWKQAEAHGEDEPEEERDPQVTHTQVSCWSKYLDTPEEVEPEEEENVLMERQKLHGNNMNDSCSDRKRRGRTDSWTPEQPNWSSLTHISPRPPSLTHISPRPPSLTHISPPSKRAVGTGAVSRWAQFLSSDCQVSEEEEPAASGWSQSVGGAVSLSWNDVITPPSSRPRPLLPVSSMFQSGDEFNFDDDFLND